MMGLSTAQSEKQAQFVRDAIARRLAQCGLELHPDKTRIVYCKDEDRRATYANERFDFLGYTFRPRSSKRRGWQVFVNFLPAVSDDAMKAMGRELRSWRINCRSDKSLDDLAQMFNNVVQGWINYYGRFYKSRLYPLLRRMNEYLVRWAKRKYKRLHGHYPTGTSSGWCALRDASRSCLPIGGWACGLTAGQWEPGELRGSRPVCAVRRVIISPAQPGDTRRRCLGYQLTRDRKINGTGACWEKGATVRRRCRAGCVRPGRHGEGLIA